MSSKIKNFESQNQIHMMSFCNPMYRSVTGQTQSDNITRLIVFCISVYMMIFIFSKFFTDFTMDASRHFFEKCISMFIVMVIFSATLLCVANLATIFTPIIFLPRRTYEKLCFAKFTRSFHTSLSIMHTRRRTVNSFISIKDMILNLKYFITSFTGSFVSRFNKKLVGTRLRTKNIFVIFKSMRFTFKDFIAKGTINRDFCFSKIMLTRRGAKNIIGSFQTRWRNIECFFAKRAIYFHNSGRDLHYLKTVYTRR